MRRFLYLCLAAALCALVLAQGSPVARGQVPAAETEAVKGKAPTAGRTMAQARREALSRAKTKAIEAFAGSIIPPGMLDKKADELKAISSAPDKYVVSWEELDQSVEDGNVIITARVELDKAALKTAFKNAGLMPSRPLPRVFLVVPGTVVGQAMPSIWEKPAGQPAILNPCEAEIARELYKYGFDVIEPAVSDQPLDPLKITAPRDDAERDEVFSWLASDYGAEVLLVGRATVGSPDQGSAVTGAGAGDALTASLRMAAADVNDKTVLWSVRRDKTASSKGLLSGQKALAGLCSAAGAEAVEVLFESRMPKAGPGEKSSLVIILDNAPSWDDVRELITRLTSEGPGVSSASLSMMKHGEVEITVETTTSSQGLARWLDGSKAGNMTISVQEVSADRIKARARLE